MNITDGKRETGQWVTREAMQRNDARKLYDRLRKRSYRRVGRLEWGDWDHKAYVAGVRDAIKEILGMSEVFDFEKFEEEGRAWNVPEYLAGMYAIWTTMGQASEVLRFAHFTAHQAAEGFEHGDTTHPPDGVLAAWLDDPCDEEEEEKTDDEKVITAHDLILTAEAAIRLLTQSLHRRLKEMEALPPWWGENYDYQDDRPIMGWEIQMLQQLLDEDDDEA